MPALDTDVLVRFLAQDDEKQSAAATRLIRRGVEAGSLLFVPVTVTLELECVLRSNYALPKSEVIQILSDLLSTEQLVFESEAAVALAVHGYRNGTADYADCVHTALAFQAGHGPLWTFDKAAAGLEGACLLR